MTDEQYFQDILTTWNTSKGGNAQIIRGLIKEMTPEQRQKFKEMMQESINIYVDCIKRDLGFIATFL